MINDFNKKELIRHELGHWIVARELGFKIGDIKLNIFNNGHNGSSKIFPEPFIDTIDELEKYLINRICVLYAGVISQLIFLDEKLRTAEKSAYLLNTYAADDHGKIMELIFILRAVRYEKHKISEKYEIIQKQDIVNEIWNKCYKIIEEKKKDIEHLTRKIEKEVTILNKEYIIKFDSLIGWLS